MADGQSTDRLENKVAVITGAASGIGAAAARLFAGHGASVLAVDIDTGKLAGLSDEIDGLECLAADVSGPGAAEDVALEAVALFGHLDILFCNAGVHGSGDTPEEKWDDAMAVNLTANHRLARAAHPYIRDTGGGSIIFTASVAGPVVGFASAHYDASKAGLVGLTRNLAGAWGADGIRVNSICPGFIDTPFIGSFWTEERLLKVRRDIALGRVGLPEEVAQAAVFLASDDASYVTGTALIVDGGWTVHYGKY